MSLSIACSSCGAKLRAPDNAAGQSFKCPKCGNFLRAPTATGTGLPDYDLSKESEEREPEEQESLRHDREPWFYGYLEKYAKILQILGYVLAAGSAVLATIWFIAGAISATTVSGGFGVMMLFLTFLGWVLGLAGIAAALLLWLVTVAAILLAVDAARNLRDLKKAVATAPIPK